jgi:hypothetical protein
MPGFFDNGGHSDRADPGDQGRLKRIYAMTAVKRIPITGIVSGYHTLPFTLVGPNDGLEETPEKPGSLKLTGRISVSPKLVVSISPDDERFAEIFPEAEPFMDRSITGRIFAFSAPSLSGAFRRSHRVRNEHLSVEAYPDGDQDLLEKVLNELSRAETINMGVIWCPQPRFYPISLERFIVSVLDRELG